MGCASPVLKIEHEEDGEHASHDDTSRLKVLRDDGFKLREGTVRVSDAQYVLSAQQPQTLGCEPFLISRWSLVFEEPLRRMYAAPRP